MFVLHVDLAVKPGAQQDIESIYRQVFYPAISAQAGFHSVGLLGPKDGGLGYRLTIAFADQESQQQWVATDLHQQVWPQVEGCCTGFSVNFYTAV
ncbi:MAG: antibiotic biosynthesis monooxygenase family protein [Terracidiphilus sp.]